MLSSSIQGRECQPQLDPGTQTLADSQKPASSSPRSSWLLFSYSGQHAREVEEEEDEASEEEAAEAEGKVIAQPRLQASGLQPWRMQQPAASQQLSYFTREQLAHLFDSSLPQHLADLRAREEELRKLQVSQETPQETPVADIAAVVAMQLRQAKQQQLALAIDELIYVLCLHKLSCAGLDLLGSVERLGEPAAVLGEAQLRELGEEDLARLLSPAVADAVVGLVASTLSSSTGGGHSSVPPAALLTHMDRVQAARLYAGQLEYGYFVRGMEAMCRQREVQLGSDSAQLVAFAAELSKEELRAACSVRSLPAWRCAVRHTGRVFGLQPPPADAGPGGLPYPQLEVTAAGAQFAPAAHIAENYDPPGATASEAAAAAASKAARGWRQAGDAASPSASRGPLPAPDLVTMRLDALQQLLLEGAALGAVLYDAECMLREEHGFPLEARVV
ncbi:hypothetical protein N2152v2_001772 [Parachlorella kessleri]